MYCRPGRWLAVVVLVCGLLAACGEDEPSGDVRTAPSTTVAPQGSGGPPRTATDVATSSDGNRYRVTLTVERGPAEDCLPPPAPGKRSLPVLVTVANETPGRPAPFPPLRVELVHPGGTEPVPVRGPSGECTFLPRVPVLEAGGSVAFRGSTPPIDQSAEPGGAGDVVVAMSESQFALTVPVP